MKQYKNFDNIHIDNQTLTKYFNNEVSKKEEFIIEEELLNSDESLMKYVSMLESSINKKDTQKLTENLSQDFTDKILETVIIRDRNLKKNRRVNLMTYYVAVASITLIFSFTGMFDRVFSDFNLKVNAIENRHKSVTNIDNKKWTETLTDKTTIFIDNFKLIGGKEGE